jgi:hypothetical protein
VSVQSRWSSPNGWQVINLCSISKLWHFFDLRFLFILAYVVL